MKTVNEIRRASAKLGTQTRALGNGAQNLEGIENHLDRFLEDAQRLDEAVWRAIQDSKESASAG